MTETKDATAKPSADLKSEAPVENQIAPMVASPTGPVPLSALAATEEEAEELQESRDEQLKAEKEAPRASGWLTKEQLEGLSGREVAEIARQRGYEVRGGRLGAEQLLGMQDEDEYLEKPKTTKAAK